MKASIKLQNDRNLNTCAILKKLILESELINVIDTTVSIFLKEYSLKNNDNSNDHLKSLTFMISHMFNSNYYFSSDKFRLFYKSFKKEVTTVYNSEFWDEFTNKCIDKKFKKISNYYEKISNENFEIQELSNFMKEFLEKNGIIMDVPIDDLYSD